ncbi:MAG: choice-of-anchor P family protein, partial [Gaiella sp.]|uniref:choice-of-anchor P family protein n=1 Tax=Gaiella sp. TaxID=2663207 RepID=UPI003C74D656
SVLRVGTSTATATAQSGTSSAAEGVVKALAVSMFAGEITADAVDVRAVAAAGTAGATGDVGTSIITGLTVLGQAVTPSGNVQLPLADWGTLDVLSSTRSTSDVPRSAESTVTGLRVRLIAEHNGLPAGTQIVVGSATVRAVAQATPTTPPPAHIDGAPRAAPTVPASPKPTRVAPLPNAPKEPGRSIPGAPPEVVRAAPEVVARLSRGGYVFPVFGPAAFGNSFGAYRGDVAGKWHHGEDLVAPAGTPLLAVADGTLFSVGWNDIGGWRLWLRDDAGNEFYYAHLSAYSPLAIAGKRVKAGDVLGFVGNSGDADGGVTHLHFEIHPVDLLKYGYDGAVAPYPFLVAWRRADDISFSEGRTYVLGQDGLAGPPGAPVASAQAGAVLISAEDISTASGLVPGALKRALAGGEARSGARP